MRLLRLSLFLATSVSIAQAQARGGGSCRVDVTLSAPWTNRQDNSTLVSINANIFNTAPVAVAVPWTLTLTNQNYGSAQQTFNLQFLNSSGGTFNGEATNFFQTLTPNGGYASIGVIIGVSNGSGFPSGAALNGASCVVTQAPPPPPPPPSGGAIESGGQLSTSNGQIIGLDGNPLFLIGVNYFGFDDGNTMIDGLWIGSESITQDFATIVYRQQLLGFNAVRLPFSFSIFDAPPKTQTYQCTQDAQSVVTAATTAPGANPSGSPPQQTYTPPSVPGVCNSYLPEDTTLNRFMYVVNFFAQNNFYIILDNQFNLDQTAINNQQQWLQRWTSLMTQLTQKYPNAAARCLLDLLNEPDAFKLQWQPQAGLPGVGDLYLAAMDAIYPVNQGVLFLIEGAGQSGLAMNWGDGIAADPAIISSKGISDTNPFFKALLQKPYLNQVVAAPHVYPPSISKATIAVQGADFWKRLSQSFGYLNKQGYCSGSNTVGAGTGTCHVFPVIIGEVGTSFEESRDTQPMQDFALWCNNQGAAADGLHSAVSGVLWWAWNANSGDTKGLVEEDWQTIIWNKVAWLQSVGLKPWYVPGGLSQQSMRPAASPPAAAVTQPPVAAPQPPVAAPQPPFSAPVASPPPVRTVPPPPPPPITAIVAPPPPTTFAQATAAPPPPSANGVLGEAYRYPGPPAPGGSTSGSSGGSSGAIESAGSQLQALTTANGVITGVDGLAVDFIGAAWYGFDNGTALAGLVGDESISLDFATQVQRLIALGFNTIELPFSFKSILQGSPSEIRTECTVTSYSELMMETNPPSIVLPYGTVFPNLTAAPSLANDSCNSYIPSDTVLSRFAYTVNFLAENGLYVRLSNRLDRDPSAIQNPQTWITSWTTLVTTLSQNEATAARLLISPLTNPDIGGLKWNPSDGKPGVTNLYIQLLDALYAINPAMLYTIQGPSQLNLTGLGGSSYVTNIPVAEIPNTKDSDPNAFFKQLLVKPYVNQIVISPRVLAPSLAGTSNSSTGSDLFNRLTTTFGYLNKQGFCVNQLCRVFPIAVSGFGSSLSNSQDSGFESDFVAWVSNSNIANDGLHNSIRSFFWNGWDPTSYAPILAENGVDLDYTKLDLLSSITLSPWYFAPTASRTPPVIPASYQNISASNASFCGATVSVSLSGSRNGSDPSSGYLGSVAVSLVNLGSISITPPWSLTLAGENYQGVSQAFGLERSQTTAEGVSGIAADSWNILWPDSTNQVTVGFVVVGGTNSSFAPSAVQVNGNNCRLQQGGSGAAATAPTALTGGSLGGAESVGTGVESLQANTATGTQALAGAAGSGGT